MLTHIHGTETRFQRTLKSPIECVGVGLHSGVRVRLRLAPAGPNTGIVFVRTDLPSAVASIPAAWNFVSDTRLCTVISNDAGSSVGTIEHLMAALRGCGVDNARIEVSGAEVPIMDGSSDPFVFLIECAGTKAQEVPRRFVKVLKTVMVGEGDRSATLRPSSAMKFSFDIDFASAAIARQESHIDLDEFAFKTDLARARTFGFLHEVEQLRRAGLARGGSLDNAVVIDGDRVVNAGGLRFADEFVRHKILDSIGDLYLAGAPIIGHFHGSRSGHALNNQLLRALFADRTAWTWVHSALPQVQENAIADMGVEAVA